MDREAVPRPTCAAVNDRDLGAVLAQMTASVDRLNAWEGGLVSRMDVEERM